MDYVAIIGTAAGALTTFSYLPELVDVLKTRVTKDLSEVWLISVSTGFVLWTYYGYCINSWPLVLFSALSLAFAMALLALKLRYK